MKDERGHISRVGAEALRTLYRQLPNSSLAAIVVTIFMVATTWPYTHHDLIWVWLLAQTLIQIGRAVLYYVYSRRQRDDQELPFWGRAHTAYLWVAGLCWGTSAFVFIHPEQPVTVALTMCGLYGLTGGAVTGNAYNPPSVYGFILFIFGAVMLRMIGLGGSGYLILGLASLAYAVILALFCRVQARVILDVLRIRFENAELLEQLKVQKAEEEAARLRAEQANLAKSQFLSAASHDLRQPLYALSLFSASLSHLTLDHAARETVARIQDNIEAMNRLFEGLLDVSRLDAGVVRADVRPVEINALFQQLRPYYLGQVESKGLTLRMVPTRVWVQADPLLLEQVLSNLLSNALKYTFKGGILVGTRRLHDGRIRLCVHDTGIGIAPGDQVRIFEEFIQVGNPERDRQKGLGLGLAIARRTASLMGCELGLASIPGRGSVFYLDLPRAKPTITARNDAPGNNPAKAAALPGVNLLIIDDDLAIRVALSQLMEQWGVACTCVEGIAEAEAHIAAGERFNVVISDYRLTGDADGFEAIERVQSSLAPKPHSILLTGDMDPSLIQRARERDLLLLHKPLKPARLYALVSALAARP